MAGNNAAPLTLDAEYVNSVVIDQDALLVNVSGNLLRNVMIKGYNTNHPSSSGTRYYQASLHGRNATARTIIPTEDITIELWDKSQQWLGNISSTEESILREGIEYSLIPNPYFPVGQSVDFYTDVSIDLFTVSSGDQTYEDINSAPFYTHDGKSRCAYVPNTLKLVGSGASTFEYKVGRNGRIGNSNDIKGYVLTHFNGYYLDLTNLNVPDNTVVSLEGDLQCECSNMGTYDIVLKNPAVDKIGGGGYTFSSIQTSDFTVAIGEYNLVNPTGGAITATVPSGVTQVGTEFWVVDSEGTASGTNTITVDFSTNGYTVSGQNTAVINDAGDGFKFIYIGSNKWISERL